MVLCERERQAVSRVLLAAGLAGSAALGACASPPGTAPEATSAPDAPAASGADAAARVRDHARRAAEAARYGIRVLAPAMPLPVATGGPVAMQELPPPCEPAAVPPAGEPFPEGGPSAEMPPADAGSVATAEVPEMACATPVPPAESGPEPEPEYVLALQEGDLARTSGVVLQTGVGEPPRPWFSSVNAVPVLAYDDRHWTYRVPSGPTVALGNLVANAPAWGSSAPIGGVQLYSGFEEVKEGQLGYSSVFGRINNMDPAATAGAVDYGASAASGALRYGLTPSLTLEGQVQTAPDLTAHGLGTTYSAGEYGTFQAGVTRSSFDAVHAWRYRFGYNVSLADTVRLGVTGERVQGRFGDLATYESGGSAPYARSTWSAGVPLASGGILSGTYSVGLNSGSEPDERRLGLLHSRQLAPGVQFDLGADRDIVSGDYEMRANITMPVDAFMRGRWLEP